MAGADIIGLSATLAGGRRFVSIESPEDRAKRQRREQADEYRLEAAYRPTTLMLEMARAGAVLERPVLTVYKGIRANRREFLELHLGVTQ